MVIRFSAFHQTLRAGQFPIRFVDRLNSNYGYPVLNFLYPLPFYLAEIPKAAGLNFADSIKFVFAASTIFSSIAMFWALSQRFSQAASFAASVVYLFIPYRFVDLYVRGSLGESLAFAVVPLCLGAIFKIASGKKIYYPLLSLSLALLIISHNVMAVLFLPIFFIVSVALVKKDKVYLLGAFLLGILMASFFAVPALFDLKLVKLSTIKVGNPLDHLSSLKDLIIPKWGYGPTPGGNNPLPTQIGIVPLFIAVAALLLQISKKGKDHIVKLFLITFILVIFLMSKLSAFFWANFPFSDLIQFPWRLLSLIALISAYLTAYVVDESKNKKILVIIIVVASILATILYIKPKAVTYNDDGFYSTNEGTTTVRDEYLPLWVKQQKPTRANTKIELPQNAQIQNLSIRPTLYSATINSPSDANIQVNSIYFPGWIVTVDNKKTPINVLDDFGLINFQLPAGKHEVIIKYTESPVATAADIVSIVAVLITGFSFYKLWANKKS